MAAPDLLVGGIPSQTDGEVYYRHIQGGHAEGHTGQLALQRGDYQSAGLGSAGRGGDNVAGSSASASPVLLGRTIHGLLGGCGGVNSGHQAFLDAKGIVDDLSQRSQTVGGAGCIDTTVISGCKLLH